MKKMSDDFVSKMSEQLLDLIEKGIKESLDRHPEIKKCSFSQERYGQECDATKTTYIIKLYDDSVKKHDVPKLFDAFLVRLDIKV